MALFDFNLDFIDLIKNEKNRDYNVNWFYYCLKGSYGHMNL